MLQIDSSSVMVESSCNIAFPNPGTATTTSATDNKKDGCTKNVQTENSNSSTISLCACRICQTSKSKEALISPCHCKGTLGKVHLTCLERWLNMSGKQHCEICRFQFEARRKKRYSICQSIRIWIRHPAHRTLLKSDAIVASILTTVTMGLCLVSIFGLKYFVEEGQKIGVPSIYTKGILIMFLVVILIGYITTLYLMAKDHIIPWHRWWTRCMVIKIVLSPMQPKTEEALPITTHTSKLAKMANVNENFLHQSPPNANQKRPIITPLHT